MADLPHEYAAWLSQTPRSFWTRDTFAHHLGKAWPSQEPPFGVVVAGLDAYRQRALQAMQLLYDAQPGDADWEAMIDAWVYGRCEDARWCNDPPKAITPLLAEGWILQRAIGVAEEAQAEALRKLKSDLTKTTVRSLLPVALFIGAIWLLGRN